MDFKSTLNIDIKDIDEEHAEEFAEILRSIHGKDVELETEVTIVGEFHKGHCGGYYRNGDPYAPEPDELWLNEVVLEISSKRSIDIQNWLSEEGAERIISKLSYDLCHCKLDF